MRGAGHARQYQIHAAGPGSPPAEAGTGARRAHRRPLRSWRALARRLIVNSPMITGLAES